MLLRLLLLLGARLLLLVAIAAAAAAAAPAVALLVVGCRLVLAGGTLLLLLVRCAGLLPLLAAVSMCLLPPLWALSFALVRRADALPRPRTLALAALVAARFRRPGALLPFPQFLLHETALLRLGARARLVISAVGATFPTFRIRLLAVRA
ncbi:MAG TPA: hypothetical protein VH087_01205 [Thermoanaerobaculia bacterium]|nr:hypothetical protein [Thermoanaerobaculia bacterium]